MKTLWQKNWFRLFAVVIGIGYLLLAAVFLAERLWLARLQDKAGLIARLLQEQTGLDWQLQGVELDFSRLDPVLEIQQLVAYASATDQAAGSALQEQPVREVVNLSGFQVYLNLASSIWHRQPQLYGIKAARAGLALEQREGKWRVPGLVLEPGNGSFDAEHFLRGLRYFEVPEIDLELGGPRAIDPANLSVSYRRDGERRELNLQSFAVDSPAQAGAAEPDVLLQVVAPGTLATGDIALDVYARSEREGLARWLNRFFMNSEAQALDFELLLNKKRGADLQGVFRLKKASMSLSLAGTKSGVEDESVNNEKPIVSANPFDVLLTQTQEGRYAAIWPQLTIAFAGEPIQFERGRLVYTKTTAGEREVALQMPRLDIDYLVYTLARSATWQKLLGGSSMSLLRGLDPKGQINDFALDLPLGAPQNFTASGRLDDVSVNAYQGKPGGSGITGRFALSKSGGSVVLDSDNGFSMVFPTVYREPLPFKSASGAVSWSISSDRILVQGDRLKLRSAVDNARFAANFFANARARGDEASTLTLEIGVQDGQVENLLAYVPYKVPGSLSSWLEQSAAGGRVESGGFFYNGSLRGSESKRRSIAMFFQLDDAELNYAPDWPRVEAVDGLLMVRGNDANFWGERGRTAELQLGDIEFALAQGDTAQQISVDAGLEGETGRLLQFLQTSPVNELTGDVLQSWQASGDFREGSLKLRLPLQGMNAQNIKIETRLRLADSSLSMPNLGLELDRINGELGFSSERNFYGESLAAELWKSPVQISLGQRQLGGGITDITASANIAVSDVAHWLDVDFAPYIRGRSDVELLLQVAAGENSELSGLTITSGLQGVEFDLPSNLRKAAQEQSGFRLDWEFAAPQQPLFIQLQRRGYITAAFDDFSPAGAVVQLGEVELTSLSPSVALDDVQKAGLYAPRHITLSGAIESFALEEWRPLLAGITARKNASDDEGAVLQEDTPGWSLRGKQIEIGRAELFGQQFVDSSLGFESEGDTWWLDIHNAIVSGRAGLPATLFELLDSRGAQGRENGQLKEEAEGTDTQVALADEEVTLLPLPSLPELPKLDKDVARIVLDLDYLRLDNTSPKNKNNSDEPVISNSLFSPKSLIPLQVKVDQLYWNTNEAGSWKFLLTPGESTALVHAIEVEGRALSLASEADDGLLWAEDSQGNIASSLDIKVSSRSFEQFLKSFRQGQDQESVPMSSELMEADVDLSWPAAPTAIALPLLDGSIDFKFEKGRFYQASRSTTGILKLLGLINFDSILRRIQLDFEDVYKEGVSFDSITGRVDLLDNRVSFKEKPIELKSPSSNFRLSGVADLSDNTIDGQLVATLPVASNLPWIAALAGGLPGVAGAYVFKQMFGDQIEKFSRASYTISGSLNDPQVKFDKLFENKKTEN